MNERERTRTRMRYEKEMQIAEGRKEGRKEGMEWGSGAPVAQVCMYSADVR